MFIPNLLICVDPCPPPPVTPIQAVKLAIALTTILL